MQCDVSVIHGAKYGSEIRRRVTEKARDRSGQAADVGRALTPALALRLANAVVAPPQAPTLPTCAAKVPMMMVCVASVPAMVDVCDA